MHLLSNLTVVNIPMCQVGSLRGLCAGGSKGRDKDGLKAQLATVLGLLIRHATVIDSSLASTGARQLKDAIKG